MYKAVLNFLSFLSSWTQSTRQSLSPISHLKPRLEPWRCQRFLYTWVNANQDLMLSEWNSYCLFFKPSECPETMPVWGLSDLAETELVAPSGCTTLSILVCTIGTLDPPLLPTSTLKVIGCSFDANGSCINMNKCNPVWQQNRNQMLANLDHSQTQDYAYLQLDIS